MSCILRESSLLNLIEHDNNCRYEIQSLRGLYLTIYG